jgi:ABC-type Fe3+ transport system permease subunit
MNTWLFTHFSAACPGGNFLVFPPWYKYLDSNGVDGTGLCTPKIVGINDVWLILAAVIEILLRVAALAAIGFVIWGGFEYITSQGEPDKTNKARQTVINALVGLVIAVMASLIINFIAGSVK